MKKIFTKQEIIDNRGCYDIEKVETLSFINNPEITIEDIVNSEITLKDKFWFVCRKCELTNKQKVQISYEAASIVLPIFEGKYPDVKTPREVLVLVDRYLNGEDVTSQQLRNAAAAYATYAVDATYAAAYAAAADAVYAADAKSPVNYTEKLLNLL